MIYLSLIYNGVTCPVICSELRDGNSPCDHFWLSSLSLSMKSPVPAPRLALSVWTERVKFQRSLKEGDVTSRNFIRKSKEKKKWKKSEVAAFVILKSSKIFFPCLKISLSGFLNEFDSIPKAHFAMTSNARAWKTFLTSTTGFVGVTSSKCWIMLSTESPKRSSIPFIFPDVKVGLRPFLRSLHSSPVATSRVRNFWFPISNE